MSSFEDLQLEHQHYKADLDKHGNKLVPNEPYMYGDIPCVFIEICPPLMFACVQTGKDTYDYVKPEDLEAAT